MPSKSKTSYEAGLTRSYRSSALKDNFGFVGLSEKVLERSRADVAVTRKRRKRFSFFREKPTSKCSSIATDAEVARLCCSMLDDAASFVYLEEEFRPFLPYDALTLVFSYLSTPDILSARAVCSGWQTAAGPSYPLIAALLRATRSEQLAKIPSDIREAAESVLRSSALSAGTVGALAAGLWLTPVMVIIYIQFAELIALPFIASYDRLVAAGRSFGTAMSRGGVTGVAVPLTAAAALLEGRATTCGACGRRLPRRHAARMMRLQAEHAGCMTSDGRTAHTCGPGGHETATMGVVAAVNYVVRLRSEQRAAALAAAYANAGSVRARGDERTVDALRSLRESQIAGLRASMAAAAAPADGAAPPAPPPHRGVNELADHWAARPAPGADTLFDDIVRAYDRAIGARMARAAAAMVAAGTAAGGDGSARSISAEDELLQRAGETSAMLAVGAAEGVRTDGHRDDAVERARGVGRGGGGPGRPGSATTMSSALSDDRDDGRDASTTRGDDDGGSDAERLGGHGSADGDEDDGEDDDDDTDGAGHDEATLPPGWDGDVAALMAPRPQRRLSAATPAVEGREAPRAHGQGREGGAAAQPQQSRTLGDSARRVGRRTAWRGCAVCDERSGLAAALAGLVGSMGLADCTWDAWARPAPQGEHVRTQGSAAVRTSTGGGTAAVARAVGHAVSNNVRAAGDAVGPRRVQPMEGRGGNELVVVLTEALWALTTALGRERELGRIGTDVAGTELGGAAAAVPLTDVAPRGGAESGGGEQRTVAVGQDADDDNGMALGFGSFDVPGGVMGAADVTAEEGVGGGQIRDTRNVIIDDVSTNGQGALDRREPFRGAVDDVLRSPGAVG